MKKVSDGLVELGKLEPGQRFSDFIRQGLNSGAKSESEAEEDDEKLFASVGGGTNAVSGEINIKFDVRESQVKP